jgi:hypothetical protein
MCCAVEIVNKKVDKYKQGKLCIALYYSILDVVFTAERHLLCITYVQISTNSLY